MKSRNIIIGEFRSIHDCTRNYDIFHQSNEPMVCWKDPLPTESEWKKVCQMRKEKNPLIKGGHQS